MKWFKHFSNMRNDHFIKQLRHQFGLEGYAIYCLILEIYAENCGTEPGKEVELDEAVLRAELGIKRKTMENIFTLFSLSNKFLITFRENKVIISIPKMAQLKDNYTKDLQVACKLLAPKKQKKEVRNTPLPPKGESEGFKKFWNSYPNATTKKESRDYWHANKLDDRLEEILNGLDVWKSSSQWAEENGRFIPDPIRFLKKERWLDKPRGANLAAQPTGMSHGRKLMASKQIINRFTREIVKTEDLTIDKHDQIWTKTGTRFPDNEFEPVEEVAHAGPTTPAQR